jgi:hypothetical protein
VRSSRLFSSSIFPVTASMAGAHEPNPNAHLVNIVAGLHGLGDHVANSPMEQPATQTQIQQIFKQLAQIKAGQQAMYMDLQAMPLKIANSLHESVNHCHLVDCLAFAELGSLKRPNVCRTQYQWTRGRPTRSNFPPSPSRPIRSSKP